MASEIGQLIAMIECDIFEAGILYYECDSRNMQTDKFMALA